MSDQEFLSLMSMMMVVVRMCEQIIANTISGNKVLGIEEVNG